MRLTVIPIVIGCVRNDLQRLNKRAGRVGNRRTSRDNLNYNITEIGLNTENSPVDLLSLRLQWKTIGFCRREKNSQIIIIIIIKGINTWAVLLVRYSGPFLKWTREELQKMDQRTRKEGGRGFTCIPDRVGASIQRLEDYIKKRGGRLITAKMDNTDNTSINRTKTNKLENKNLKKNNCMYTSSNKQAKSHTRRPRQG